MRGHFQNFLSKRDFISKLYHIKISSQNFVIYHIKTTAARHSSPIGVGADPCVILSLFTDTMPTMPCGTAPTTLSPEPFLFRLRRNRNGSGFQNDNHNHFKGTVILSYIISKGGAFVISKKPSYGVFH